MRGRGMGDGECECVCVCDRRGVCALFFSQLLHCIALSHKRRTKHRLRDGRRMRGNHERRERCSQSTPPCFFFPRLHPSLFLPSKSPFLTHTSPMRDQQDHVTPHSLSVLGVGELWVGVGTGRVRVSERWMMMRRREGWKGWGPPPSLPLSLSLYLPNHPFSQRTGVFDVLV